MRPDSADAHQTTPVLQRTAGHCDGGGDGRKGGRGRWREREEGKGGL